ncbi:hypothetical protein ACN28S_09965 [Cystobacter fuscus]
MTNALLYTVTVLIWGSTGWPSRCSSAGYTRRRRSSTASRWRRC